jgi:NADH-quinone oxidoreductase subunit E
MNLYEDKAVAFETQPAPNPADIKFDEADYQYIAEVKARYPEARAAVMRVLWLAQEKFGWLSQEAIRLVADSLGLPHAEVFGVASFYTMYWKKPVGKTHLAICTNISCMLTGGDEIFNYVKKKYGINKNEVTKDGSLSLEEAECLGSCGTAPMMQVNNREYVETLTLEKLEEYLKSKGL